jgi:hypothetical protein
MLLLNPPHKPLLEVTAMIKTLFAVLLSEKAFSDRSNVALKFDKISCNFSEYGRICVIASCARFNFAADTIFIAEVICIVDPTDVIRLRISFKFAIFF